MYALKLLDTILQAVVFMTGVILFFVFGATGYLYWILVSLTGWLFISSLLHLITKQKITAFRIAVWVIVAVLTIAAGLYFVFGGKVERINFFFWPFSLLILITYLILSITELQNIQTKGKVDLDF